MSVILLADDELPLVEVMGDVIAMLGHVCITATDGEEALRLARDRRPDLVITDCMMPRLSGLEVLHALRVDRELGRTPVILISAARPPGIDASTPFLQKPIHVEELDRAIRLALAPPGGAPETPAASQSG